MALRLISVNLNGIRSAASKGFLEWAGQARADCMGVQEVRAQQEDIAGRFDTLPDAPAGSPGAGGGAGGGAALRGHFHLAQQKGYSGVGLYTRHEPSEVIAGFGHRAFDAEGRWVELRFDRPGRRFSVVSCYFPSGSSSEERQAAKFRFLARLYPHLMKLKAEREFVLMGDVNIAHREIDLKNWRGNLKNSGFLPEERAWLDKLFGAGGLVDVFRALDPRPEQYTWWSNRGQARAKNVGWRIDYQIATPAVAASARRAEVYTAQRFSDHAPVIVDYDWAL